MSVTIGLSVGEVTTGAAWIAGLAILALVLAGWRKPARASVRKPRNPLARPVAPLQVDHLEGPRYRRAGPVRRLLALGASGGLAVVTGAVIATVVAFGVAWAVITLTGLLRS